LCYHWILLGFTGFYLVIPGLLGLAVLLLDITGFYRVLLDFNVLSLGITGFHRALPGFYWVQLSYHWVLLHFTGQTLSSLALVFALHYYKPTPLYVMDEIDAALDFKNVSIVGNYIRERTRNAQFIIISLRFALAFAIGRLLTTLTVM